jgi:ATP-binding cassette subfamily B protein
MAWSASRLPVACWAVATVVQGASPAALAWSGRRAVDALVGAAQHRAPPGAALAPALAVASVLVLLQLATSAVAYLRARIAEEVHALATDRIHAHALWLDLAFFEHPESYDLLHRARTDAVQQSTALLDHLAGVSRAAISVLGLSLLVARYALWAPALLLAAALPGLLSTGAHVVREYRWRRAHTADERRLRYWESLLTGREAAAELRLFALGDHFREAHRRLWQRLREGRLDLARGRLAGELVAALLALGGMALGVGWVIERAARGQATPGDVVLFYQVFQQAQAALRTMLESGSGLFRAILFLDDLEAFLAHPRAIEEPARPVTLPPGRGPAVEFDRVSFRYPASERFALADISLVLPPGRIVAVVGANGAGKSTLIKLLCRFHDPTSGAVRLGGVDLRDASSARLRRRITVLFQEPVRYAATVTENIAFGDLGAQPDADRIAAAAAAAGADGPVGRLPESYETVLGKWLGGAELSSGEWQRIALARAFLRDADVVVLDEPTSAMDSWAEADWMGRFRELVQGRTTLIITHRFTTAMRADAIFVMREGRIVETGSHDALLAAGGAYAESWWRQMRDRERHREGERRAS